MALLTAPCGSGSLRFRLLAVPAPCGSGSDELYLWKKNNALDIMNNNVITLFYYAKQIQ
jgi:hypothetical protein